MNSFYHHDYQSIDDAIYLIPQKYRSEVLYLNLSALLNLYEYFDDDLLIGDHLTLSKLLLIIIIITEIKY